MSWFGNLFKNYILSILTVFTMVFQGFSILFGSPQWAYEFIVGLGLHPEMAVSQALVFN